MKCSSRLDTAEDILLECIDWKNLRCGSSFIAERFQNSHIQRSILPISLPQNIKASCCPYHWAVDSFGGKKCILNNSRVLKLPTGAPKAKSKMLRQRPSSLDTTWCNMMQWSFSPQGTSVNLVETLMIHGWALHPLEKKHKNMIYCSGCICNAQDLLQNHPPDTPVSHPPRCQTWMDEVLLPLLGGKLENLGQVTKVKPLEW